MTPQKELVRPVEIIRRRPQYLAKKPPKIETGVLKFIPLGGCGEVTRSMYIYEYGDDIVIIDMGLQFPEEDMPGIDYLIPNIEYLIPKKKNIRGIIITHGHYDHIGAIPHLVEPLGHPPVYTMPLTRGMILKRQEDFKHLGKLSVEVIREDSKLKFGSFEVEFFRVNHNIPDSIGVILKSPAGTIVHTGDWKFDHTPVNEKPIDVERLKGIGDKGVMLLVSDSTGAKDAGRTISESEIQKNLEEIFKNAKGRIICATFSSLLTRIQQLIWLSEKYGRKVLVEGYSMKSNVAVSQELGYLKVKRGTFIGREEFETLPDEQVTIICTGAQGEDHAVMMRIANSEHKFLSLKGSDSVVFSSSVVPGNEASVQRLKDLLYKKAGKIYHSESMDIHASGHAKSEDIKDMIRLIRPRYFIPMHGNYFMLRIHAELAIEAGVKGEHVAIAEDGEIIEMNSNQFRKSKEKAPTSYVMVDGLGVGDIKEVVLRDRQMLSEDGIFVIIAVVDSQSGKIKGSPDIISRGFVYLKESRELLASARHLVKKVTEETTSQMHPINWAFLRDEIREELGKFLFRKTKRRPMVLPVIIEI
ncbi:ribonuclease J [Candidatus Giovannonibacteria bacterium]|nr:ribonuclease J [Candidatus Giovannonibacteria bacterium]